MKSDFFAELLDSLYQIVEVRLPVQFVDLLQRTIGERPLQVPRQTRNRRILLRLRLFINFSLEVITCKPPTAKARKGMPHTSLDDTTQL